MNNSIILSPEMQTIFNETQGMTGGNMYITGKAGTGKTTLLKYLVENSRKNVIVTAPTGVAAVNAGGVTLHSLFMIPFGPLVPGAELEDNMPKPKRTTIRKMEILIIDEISMVRPDTLDFVNRRLKQIRKSPRPFGGIQVVMFGDLYQLPPVIKNDEMEILKPWYDSQYFFSAQVWKETGFRVHELTKVYRQTDTDFIEVLNRLRDYRMKDQDVSFLSSLYGKPVDQAYQETCIHLCTHKRNAEYINGYYLGTVGLKTYTAVVTGKFPESSMPGLLRLTLREGARVMSLLNDPMGEFFNGSLGIVTELTDSYVKVKFDTGPERIFGEYIWKNTEYKMIQKVLTTETVGECRQIPLVPAWAITVHKSQGLTFDNVFLHVGNVFSPGQLYVALSRCRSLEGLRSDTPITKSMIIPDTKLIEFDEECLDHEGFWYKGE